MDLSQFDTISISEQGAVMEVRHPTMGTRLEADDGSPVTITVAGMDSTRFRRQQRQNTDRRLKGTRRNVSADELEAENLDLIIACLISWENIVVDGEKLALTSANAKKAFQRFPWLREQVDLFMGDRANFLPTSEKSS